ncbi:PD-(D/E)XK nuclease family protein [Halorhabdus amylolytica]|uniref:PD-(D/E)XK nuclease family protein n=1 Tax=Halorhabdus amylolytica TaxID=2559573 RepID=UPI0010AA57A7|nr:PD-(D/E)XK nuclease family protein [Halorhabdus amylolytica]
MSLQQARSIDDLFEEVADYDLVLTVDAPLSLALNRRLDHPRLGRFAATPQMLAADEFRPQDQRQLFVEVIDKTALPWKQAAHLVELILGCWEETGDRQAILEFDRYDTPATREVLDVIASVESAHRDLDEYRIDDDLNVAVIGESQFSELDRSILPAEYDVIDPLTSEAFDLPAFHSFASRTAIVEAIVDNVTSDNADDVAIVMDRGGPFPALIESALEAQDIPFYGGPGFADDEGLRTFLELLRLAHADSRARVGDVRPIARGLGIDLPVTDDQKLLRELDGRAIEPVQAFCAAVGEWTFGEALGEFAELSDRSLDAVRDELDVLGLVDKPVTDGRLDDLAFYLSAFDVPIDREDSGVLLADAKTSVYVDRPAVFYLGLDADWTHQVIDRPWSDTERKDREHLRQFQLLLQNGREQYYLVQETSAGEPVRPCLYFHDLLDDGIETFDDFETIPHTYRRGDGSTGFEHDPVNVAPEPIETISQSSLNTFVNCPRDYFFDQLVEQPDQDYFRKGNCYHDFAEFYVNHPDVVADADREELVDLFLDELRPFVDQVDRDVLETEFDVGLDLIERFIDENPPVERDYGEYEVLPFGNLVADHFDHPIDSPITEQWFENPELGGKGKVDLIHSPTQLLDYKSGSAKSASQVVDRSSIEEIHDKPDFQAMLYLAHHRQVRSDEPIDFVFYHFLDLVDDAITGSTDIEDALVRVTYYPETFDEWAGTQTAFDALCAGVAESNNRRKTLEKLGYDAYAQFLDGHAFPDIDEKDALLDTEFADPFVRYARDRVGEYKYVTSGIESALKTLLDLRGENYFRDDIDAFEAFLDAQIDRINEYRESSFPVGDPNLDRVTHRDLLLSEGGRDD